MTYNPDDLVAIRRYLLSTLDTHVGISAAADLDPDEVGIAGDPAHASTGGYHEGNDDLARVGRLTSDYSKRESPRDRPGTNAASALDIGEFVHGPLTLRSLTLRLVAACEAGDPRTRDVREVIYSPDGVNVKRWDRLGIRTTGDDSHLWHSHLSFFRDSEGRRAADDNILGLLRELIEGKVDDVGELTGVQAEQLSNLERFRQSMTGGDLMVRGVYVWDTKGGHYEDQPNAFTATLKALVDRVTALESKAGTVTLTDAQVAVVTKQVATALAGAPDVPLGAADIPAIEAAVRNVLRSGVGT